jgi:hypothetical protein
MGSQWWLSNIFGGVVRWVAVHVQMSPAVAGARLASFTVVILGVNEAPDFIHLDALAGQLAKHLVLIGSAGVTGFNYQLRDRVLAASG